MKYSSGEKDAQLADLQDAETKFRKACDQILLLNKHMDDFKDRYSQAKNDNYRGFRYILRLKLSVIEGVRNMYYDFAYMKAEKVAALRQDLFGEEIDIRTSDAESYEEI